MDIQNLNTENFKDTITNETRVVIVDFYADWCMPCKMIAPILEEIANENENVAIYKVNIDENPDLAMEYSVRSIPNIVSFKGGELYKRAIGAQPKDKLLELAE